MKRLLLILLMCLPVRSANEVRAVIDGAPTAYYVVREIDGDIWYVVGQVFEVFGTAARTMTDYDVALVDKSGGLYVGTFDTNISAGDYYVIAHQQAGGSPADADPPVWQELGNWDGSSVWAPGTTVAVADAVWDEPVADHTAELTFGGEVGGLDPNITLILADTDELQQDWTDGGRLDLLLDAIKAVTDVIFAQVTTVSDANDANSFTVTAGAAVEDAYEGMVIIVQDAGDSHFEARAVKTWTSGRVVVVDEKYAFTPAVSDNVWIVNVAYPGFIGKIWDIIQRIPRVVNVYDFSGSGGTQGRGTIMIDAMGDDP